MGKKSAKFFDIKEVIFFLNQRLEGNRICNCDWIRRKIICTMSFFEFRNVANKEKLRLKLFNEIL